MFFCRTCRGNGSRPGESFTCWSCKGSGVEKCERCDGTGIETINALRAVFPVGCIGDLAISRIGRFVWH